MAMDTLAEGVASNLEGAAVATRTMTSGIVGGFLSGMMFGASMGFYIGRRFGKEKIKAEAFEVSQREVENIREFYRANPDTAQGPVDFHPDETVTVRPSGEGVHVRPSATVHYGKAKPSVEEIVEERGYSTRVEENSPNPNVLYRPQYLCHLRDGPQVRGRDSPRSRQQERVSGTTRQRRSREVPIIRTSSTKMNS